MTNALTGIPEIYYTIVEPPRGVSSPKFKSKMVHTPLGPPSKWVHIFLDTLDVLIEYTMTNSGREWRWH
jgi:hypothetical protein